ncbi:MAG TPA: DUF3604 domain-containing protein [Woeseiaceae bacterium]
MKKFFYAVSAIIVIVIAGSFLITSGVLVEIDGVGPMSAQPVPAAAIEERGNRQAAAAATIGEPVDKQILFGDLHVHTTYSFDAFLSSLPMMNDSGSHPLGNACDFARYCSALDFWSINDHAEALTSNRWQETISAIQQCNAVSESSPVPDTVAFLGWEWSQVGRTPDEHFGHKNVIFLETDADKVPTRPIHSGGLARIGLRGLSKATSLRLFALDPNRRMLEFAEYLAELRAEPDCGPDESVRDLPSDCAEGADTPEKLFAKLDDWGFPSMVIPHGTTWGFYTPGGSTWDKQLQGGMHDEDKQFLLEMFSGHGNSEEYRDFRAIVLNEAGQPVCPAATDNYLPSCQRAGQIIQERCLLSGAGAKECEHRAALARQDYVNLGNGGHVAVSGEEAADWLDAGQCKDCFLPAFNYRPGGAAQYILAITNFDDPANPRRFRFGFMASSDNHRARPGTGYKEFFRKGMTEAVGPRNWRGERAFRAREPEPMPYSEAVFLPQQADIDLELIETGSPRRTVDVPPLLLMERERQASFFTTGGLIAVHAPSRDRAAIWNSMEAKEVYGTSGERILLWFDLLNAPAGETVVMGGAANMNAAPQFEVRAIGAFEQLPGCPDYAVNNLGPERLEDLCRGECYNPSDVRKTINRIEVVRVLPQIEPGENVRQLIQDPWKILPCSPDPNGCTATFSDEEYASLGRDAVYYVRAIEEPSLTVNADNLRCEYDDAGNCIKVNMCYGGRRTPDEDDCLALSEERAWSSPIFVDWLPPASVANEAAGD